MHKLANFISPGEVSFEKKSPIKLVIGYEDFATGEQAMQSCTKLMNHLTHEFQFSTTLWKFDVLRLPKLREIATEDMAEADMVVIAAHGSEDLPGEVKSWVATLPGKRGGGAKALVALLEDSVPQESPIDSYLAEVARKGNVDFFSHRYSAEEEVDESFGTLAEARDWGINE